MDNALAEIEQILMVELKNPNVTAKSILLKFRTYFAKGAIYIPFDYAARNAEIMRQYNGDNIRQLASEYRLSRRQISSILKGK